MSVEIFDREAIKLIVARRDIAEMDAAMNQITQAYSDCWPDVQKAEAAEFGGEYSDKQLSLFVLMNLWHEKLATVAGQTFGVETGLGYWLQSLDEAREIGWRS
jgi:hypothetical protein